MADDWNKFLSGDFMQGVSQVFDPADIFGVRNAKKQGQMEKTQAKQDALSSQLMNSQASAEQTADGFRTKQDTAQAAQDKYSASAQDWSNQGKSAVTDWLKGGQSGQIAGEQARRGAADVSSQAAGTARSMGLNAAMAAKQGGQAGGNAYSGLYSNVFGNTYGAGANALNQTYATGAGTASNLAGQYGQQAANYGNQAVGQSGVGAAYGSAAGSTIVGQAQNQFQQAQANQAQAGAIGDIAGDILGKIFGSKSDERVKRTITSGKGVIDAVFEKVNPYRFKYKEGTPGEDPNKEHVGVMAQDLEQTPLKDAVIDTPEGKIIDTKQMTMANTAMLSELNDKLNRAMGMLKSTNKTYKKAG